MLPDAIKPFPFPFAVRANLRGIADRLGMRKFCGSANFRGFHGS